MPFAPDVAIDLSTPVPKAVPAITATVRHDPAESAIKGLSVQFPKAFGYNERFRSPRCLAADEAARACPPSSQVGTVTAQSIVPAAGKVYVTDDFRLVIFADAAGGLIALKIEARIVVAPSGGFGIDFSGFPDLPISEVELSLDGDDTGLLKNPGRCGTYAIPTRFSAFDGSTATASPAVAVTGCAPAVRRVRVRPGAKRIGVAWQVGPGTTGTVVDLERRRAGAWRRVGRQRVATTTTSFGSGPAGRYRVRLRALGQNAPRTVVTRAFRVTP